MAAPAFLHRRVATPAPRSTEAANLLTALIAAPLDARRDVYAELTAAEWETLLAEAEREFGTPYGLWSDDPVGFVRDVLGETLWSKQNEMLEALLTHRRIAVPAGFGVGKCVSMGDRIPLADGRYPRAAELVGTCFQVMAWQEDGTQIARDARAEWNATEPTYRVTTTSGRVITRNAAHPLWSAEPVSEVKGGHARGTVTLTPKVRGWTPTAELVPGDLLLVPELHHAEGTVRVPPDHAALLGYLLGDGGTAGPAVSFTQKPGPALDEFRDIASRLGCTLVRRHRPYDYGVIGTIRRYNPVLELVRGWGLAGKKSKDKTFPDWVWTLPNDQLAVVLGRLFACDGWVYCRENASRVAVQVGIALASETMIRDVEHAMLRLGVWGNVRARTVKAAGKTYPAWEWVCRDREAIQRLAEVMDCPGKTEKLRATAALLAERSTARTRAWPRRDAPSGYRWDPVKTIEFIPQDRTVAIEVATDHTFVTSVVEHNTHLAARAVAFWCCTNPVGVGLAVTIATRMRQVQRQLWPHIRRLHARAGLPGECDMTQWRMPDPHGVMTDVAYGFTAPAGDESGMQGIHAAKILLVADEAGGLEQTIGRSTRNLLTGDATMLAIGNPASDDEQSWFESLVEAGLDPERPADTTIRIRALDSPGITGEPAGVCRECPPAVAEHSLAIHLVDQEWIDDALKDYGPDDPYVIAKVHAEFPKGATNRAIPYLWVQRASETPDPNPDGEEWVRLCDLGIPELNRTETVRRGAWVRLGVDVAADGGDEFVIAMSVGDLVFIQHAAAGAENANAVTVAGVVLRHILRAQAIAQALGTAAPVRVKVDGIGVGWAVTSTLKAWKSEGIHNADIVAVVVSEKPDREPDAVALRPLNKRAEMWLTTRSLLTPGPDGAPGGLRLGALDKRTLAQLSAPLWDTNSAGLTYIEAKKRMKSRGVRSPDRAEAVLLANYEPLPPRKKGRIITM